MIVETEQAEKAEGCVAEVGKDRFLSHAVIRRAGGSALKLQRMRFEKAVGVLDELIEIQNTTETEKSEVLAALERTIGILPRGPQRLDLIQLRRDIFNGRVPNVLPSQICFQFGQYLSAEEQILLDRWIANRRKLDEISTTLAEVFARELDVNEARLRSLCRDKVFRGGLEYSSPALSQDIEKYLANPEGFTGAKRARIQRSVIRYYARTALKLSPFSTFMRSRIVRLTEGEMFSESRRVEMVRSIGFNRTFIARLCESLAQHTELRRFVPVVVNESIAEVGERFVLIRHDYKGVWSRRLRVPNESLIELPKFELIVPLIGLIRSAGHHVFPEMLAEQLAPMAGDRDRAMSTIETLIATDILKQRIPLPEDDSSALHSLSEFLEEGAKVDSRLQDLQEELKYLIGLEEKLQQVDEPDTLRSLLSEIQAASGRAERAIGLASGPDWTGNVVFENTVEEPVGQVGIPDRWAPAIADLRAFLCEYVPLLDLNSCIRESMRYVLDHEFHGNPVPFVHFAARYRKMLRASRNGAERDYNRNPFGLSSLVALEQIWREIGTAFLSQDAGQEFDLRSAGKERGWIERFSGLKLARAVEGILPITCYVQPCLLGQDRAGLVVNNIGAGPSGAVVRVCSGLRDQITKSEVLAELSREIRTIWKTAEPCEIRATFDFNANLCPPVTERCINYMSDPTASPDSITLGSLWIGLSRDGHLTLMTDGHEIAPVAFGSLARQLHPPIARLLLALAGPEPVAYARLNGREVDSLARNAEQSVLATQRFTYGACVIRRRGWYFASANLPKNAKNERGPACFSTIRKWQRAWGLPDEVFAQTRPGGAQSDSARDNGARSSVAKKPQYIDFRNYFLAESFADLIEESGAGAYCEEALPRSDHWGTMGISRPIEIAVDYCLTT